MNTNKVGRPSYNLTFPTGEFTLNALYELNRGPRGRGKRAKVCKLTIVNHIAKAKRSRLISRLPKTVQTGKPGKPAYLYTLTQRGVVKFFGSKPVDEPVVAETTTTA